MFNWLKRIFNIGMAEANAALDKIEDPIKMTKQGITDLKSDLAKSMQALAEVKAAAIRGKKELEQARASSLDYERKAMQLLTKAQSGELDPAEADRLASVALGKKEQLDERVNGMSQNVTTLEGEVVKMEQNVQRLKSQITKWESEFKTLEARHKVSSATQRLNKQLAQIDSNGTVSLLERMKDKVNEQEALAESYQSIAHANVSEDEEIEKALGKGYKPGGQLNAAPSPALLALKAKLSSGTPSNTNTASSGGSSAGSGSSGTPPANDMPLNNAGMSELEKLKQQLKEE